tara:strand:- start:273 stop:464 length:192 start_codon:yes stop_codon:yes gene_type:complete
MNLNRLKSYFAFFSEDSFCDFWSAVPLLSRIGLVLVLVEANPTETHKQKIERASSFFMAVELD